MTIALGEPIYIQHDGAPGHDGRGNDDHFDIVGQELGYNIKFYTQPPQSPDLNICDLGLFNSMKKRCNQIKRDTKTIPQLIARVQEVFTNYDRVTLDNIWAHQINCYNEILRDLGGNQYTAPHNGSRVRRRDTDTAVSLSIDIEAYNTCIDHIDFFNYIQN